MIFKNEKKEPVINYNRFVLEFSDLFILREVIHHGRGQVENIQSEFSRMNLSDVTPEIMEDINSTKEKLNTINELDILLNDLWHTRNAQTGGIEMFLDTLNDSFSKPYMIEFVTKSLFEMAEEDMLLMTSAIKTGVHPDTLKVIQERCHKYYSLYHHLTTEVGL